MVDVWDSGQTCLGPGTHWRIRPPSGGNWALLVVQSPLKEPGVCRVGKQVLTSFLFGRACSPIWRILSTQ